MNDSNSKKILTDIATALKTVFKKYSKYSRQRGWDTITSKQGEAQIKKIIIDPTNIPVSNFEKLSFKEWLENQTEPKI